MRILLSAILAIGLAGVAFAQPPDTDPYRQMMSGVNCPMMGEHTEGALAFLKTELKITEAQNAAWDTFAAAYRGFAASCQKMMGAKDQMMGPGGGEKGMGPGGMGGSKMGARGQAAMPYPERMSSRMQMMEGRLAEMKKLQDAVRPLYAALSAEQKKTADQLLPMFTMMGGMM